MKIAQFHHPLNMLSSIERSQLFIMRDNSIGLKGRQVGV